MAFPKKRGYPIFYNDKGGTVNRLGIADGVVAKAINTMLNSSPEDHQYGRWVCQNYWRLCTAHKALDIVKYRDHILSLFYTEGDDITAGATDPLKNDQNRIKTQGCKTLGR